MERFIIDNKNKKTGHFATSHEYSPAEHSNLGRKKNSELRTKTTPKTTKHSTFFEENFPSVQLNFNKWNLERVYFLLM